MPITYRLRTNSFDDTDTDDSDAENIPPPAAPTDADDSIVLSDLVRTGEASRLRRRGAMRLEHPHQPPPQQLLAPTVIVVGSPTWESDSEDVIQGSGSGPVFTRERVRNGRTQRSRRVAGDEELDFRYTLFCGGDEDDEDVYESQPCEPYVPSPLPLYPPSKRASFPPRRRKTNGCGAVIHMSAAPRQRQGTWLAKDDASAAVVYLEPCYFDKDTASKIVRSACGCVREGIGCAVCGNPLGTRYKGCKTSGTDATSTPRRRPSMPLHPDGPRYWRAQNPTKSGPAYTYTFFSRAVSSSPSHSFPVRPPSPPSPTYSPMATLAPDDTRYTSSASIFDRLITASPAPLSDLGEEDEEEREGFLDVRYGGEGAAEVYDPDGEYISGVDVYGDPGSPDKTNELMLFPER